MTHEKKNDAVIVRLNCDSRLLFVSDIHSDSPHSDLKTLKKLLDQAVEKEAGIFVIGDIFDAMGHNHDKRSTKGDIKTRHNQSAYFNSILDEAFEYFKPYVKNIIMMSPGNHEDSILKYQEYDLLSALIGMLNREGGTIIKGDYTGWIRVQYENQLGNRDSKTIYYTHGAGGSATMSFGTLKVKRRQAVIDADIFISGHTHQVYMIPLGKRYLNKQGVQKEKECLHLSLGTFEENTEWARQKEFDPAPISGWWIDFHYIKLRTKRELSFVEQRAKVY